MNYYGNPMTRLIEELAALPGIGGKSAQRLAFHIINLPREKVAFRSHSCGKGRGEILFCLLQPDRGGNLPRLREPEARPFGDYGGGGPQRYGSV